MRATPPGVTRIVIPSRVWRVHHRTGHLGVTLLLVLVVWGYGLLFGLLALISTQVTLQFYPGRTAPALLQVAIDVVLLGVATLGTGFLANALLHQSDSKHEGR